MNPSDEFECLNGGGNTTDKNALVDRLRARDALAAAYCTVKATNSAMFSSSTAATTMYCWLPAM